MDTLQGQLKTLRETIDAFPVGAATCKEYSLENEVTRTVDTITLVSARLLMLRAQDKQRKYTFCDAKADMTTGRPCSYIGWHIL
jgi:hypothetical protein